MSAPPYMRLYWADYHQDTRHLTRDEHGAYFLLIGEAWNRGGYLPDDDGLLARWALATADEWTRLKPIVMAFFRPASGGRWKHKRIAEELTAYTDVSRKRKAAGKRGGQSRGGKQTEIGEANASHLVSESRHNQNQNQNHIEESPRKPPEGAKRGSRLSPDWQPSEIDHAYAASKGFTPAEIDRHAERFRNYWTAKAGAAALKLDWPATWRNWIISEAERRPGSAPTQKRVDWV